VLAVTAEVVMVKAGETVAPAGTVTEAGTTAAALLLVSVTTAPPTGAGPVSVTVLAVVGLPPITEAGDNVRTFAVTGGWTMVKPVKVLLPAGVATVTVAGPGAALGETVKVAVISVLLTTTTLVTVTPGLFTETVAPLTKFAPFRVMDALVPVVITVGRTELNVTGPDSTTVKTCPPTVIVPS
jgi:hypothetical protein